jgi:two-component system sensor histidine kinase BaeS
MTDDLDRERLAVLVHEVRSPVAALSAIAEAVAEADFDAVARAELVGLVLAACRGIERIVADVAVVSIRLEEVDLRELVADSVAAARLRGAPVHASVADDLPLLEADPARLHQALDNLIANAVTHGAPSDVVVVGSATDNAVLISVSDRGAGIPLEDQARIFEAGVRLGSGASGMGLGLALTRAIVEGHGGTLAVASAPGEGATFTIELPRTPSP